MIEKVGILKCVSHSIKYSFANIKNISLLILQIYPVIIIFELIINAATNVNLFLISADPAHTQFLSVSSLFILIFVYLSTTFLQTSLKLSISRHIILNESFNINLLTLVQQKRYWYCFWASLKMLIGIFLIYILISLVLLVFNVTVIVVFALLASLFGAAITYTHPSILESLENLSIGGIILMMIFIVPLLIFVAFAEFFVCGSIVVSFIYVSLFAALDKKAKFRESWKIMKGNRLRILSIVLIILTITSLSHVAIIFPLSYLATGSILKTTPWLGLFNMLLGLYLSLPLTAAIAFSYRSLFPDEDNIITPCKSLS